MSIFDPQIERHPDLYPWTQQFKKAMHAGFWTVDKFDFTSDANDFQNRLTPNQQAIVVKVLTAIAQVEVAVKTFWGRLGDNLPHPSIQGMGYVMANVEEIHNDAYDKLLRVLGLEHVFREALSTTGVIGNRVNYLRKHVDKKFEDRQQYLFSLILFTLFMENCSLFSQFYIITWINRNLQVLGKTTNQVAYTAKEEVIHALVGIKLVQTIREECPELFTEEFKQIVQTEAKDAIRYEYEAIDWMLQDSDLPNFDVDALKAYLGNRMNDALIQIGFDPVIEVDNEALALSEWMDEELLLPTMTDFFDGDPIDYSKNTQSFEPDALFD